MAPFKPRWTKTESKVVQEWIEQDSYSRPLGRFVRCPKCCYSDHRLTLLGEDPGRSDMGTPMKDVLITENASTTLLLEKHIKFISAYSNQKDGYDYRMTEYLRLSGMYWGLTVMDLMDSLHLMDKDDVLDFVRQCQTEGGGFGASIGHDQHILYTLSAIQILVLYDTLDTVDIERVVSFIKGLQQEDGSFVGDKWEIDGQIFEHYCCAPQFMVLMELVSMSFVLMEGLGSTFRTGEIDTRFSFCAVACLSLLGRLDVIDTDKAVEFVVSCMNFDGGFGCRPGSESHSGQIYCCVGMLSLLKQLHQVNADTLGWWLCERQLPSGGLNGRPEKLPDVCYSWWVLASLKIIGRIHWINKEKLVRFIHAAQDDETGGFADRPGDMVDPFHTLFGVAGLSLLGNDQIKLVNPVFCMPEETIRRIGLQPQLL